MFDALRRDASQYASTGGWWRNLGFWVGAIYRLGAWGYRLPGPLLRFPVLAAYWLIKQPFRLVLHVEIPARARIGPGLLLPHPYNVILGPGVEIGRDCVIFHEVTLGFGAVRGVPKLGDNVVLFAGARVLGGVTVGERAEVGANCVVFTDVPAATVVVPAQGRVIPQSLVRRSARPAAGAAEAQPAKPPEASGAG
jgi:serine O-acetyltransferase